MLDFFKKGIEFNKLAKSFNAVYMSLNEITQRVESNKNNLDFYKEEYKESLFALCYVAKKGIIDRLDSINWNFESKIMIPTMSSNRITVGYAWSQTISKLITIGASIRLSEEMEEIFDCGDLYYEMENAFPDKLKNW
jgi:hypothetical protein